MEMAFVLIVPLVMAIALMLETYRFNDTVARKINLPVKEQPFYLANNAGKWLALLGGIATTPMISALVFIPNNKPSWVVVSGMGGLVAMLIASLTLGFIFTKICKMRKLKITHVLSLIVQRLVAMIPQLIARAKRDPIKAASWITGTAILFIILPFIVQTLTALLCVAGFIMAARFGLLDNVGEKEEDWSFGYSDEEYIEASNYYYYYDDDD